MTGRLPLYALKLVGPFRLTTAQGDRISIASKKSRALLAVLAMADDGERSRPWLQSLLWGSRPVEQAGASLRRELSSLRAALGGDGDVLITSCEGNIRLDCARFEIDARSDTADRPPGIFLEGIDLGDCDAFEDWLRDMRSADRESASAKPAPRPPAAHRDRPGQAGNDASAEPAGQNGPMLMVLPFRAAPAPTPRICSDMLSETLVEHFLQRRWLRLHAVSSPATGAENAAVGTARRGSTDYCLSGTIRFSAGNDVLHAKLVDVRDDRILWSQHFAVPSPTAADLPHILPPDLLAQLVNTVEARIDRAEQLRVWADTAAVPTPMALIMRGRWHLYRATAADARIAEGLFADAVARQPDSAQALTHLAQARAWSIWSERQDDPAILDLRRLACRAIAADHEDYRGHLLCAVADTWRRQTAAALISLERAIALASSALMPQAQLGSTLYLAGRPDEAQLALDAAVRLSPNDQQLFWVRGQLAMTALMRDDVAMAVGHADAALAARAGYWFAHVIKINALARSQNGNAARQALGALMTGKPSFDARCIDWVPFVDPAWNAYLKQGLALAAAAGNAVAADAAGPGAPARRSAPRRPPAIHRPSLRQPAILHR